MDDLARMRELAQIRNGEMDERALKEIAMLTHRIHGSATMLGFDRVSSTAQSIAALATTFNPSQFEFALGVCAQLNELFFELQKEVFEAHTGGPLPLV